MGRLVVSAGNGAVQSATNLYETDFCIACSDSADCLTCCNGMVFI